MTNSPATPISANILPAAKATRRDWIGLAVLSMPCLLYSMDLTVLNMAIPQISADLKPTAAQLLWIMDIYGFLIAGLLVTMGTLGDRIGRRKLLMIGAAAFAVASVFAAYAPSAELLILARAVLGVAGATLGPSTLSLIRNMFLDDRERSFAIGIWVASFSAGGVLGPLMGGVMLNYFDWGSVFLLNPPVMLLLMILGPILLPEFRDPDAGKPDIPSALLSIVAILAMIYGIKYVAEKGFELFPLTIFFAGVMVLIAFIDRQKKLHHPLIDMQLFHIPSFSAALIINMLALFAIFGFFIFIAQYLQLVLAMTPLEAGLWTAPSGLVFIAGSMYGPILARRFTVAYVLAAGFIITGIGFVILTQIGGRNDLWIFLLGYLFFCLGVSPIGSLTTDIVVSSAPVEKAGAASAISETSFEFGGAVGIAVLGSILTASYRTTIARALPQDIAPEAAQTAQNTLGGAIAVAEQLTGETGAALLNVARTAFLHSMQLTAAFCAVMMLITAVVTLKYLTSRK